MCILDQILGSKSY